jgi:hypothetical protein
MLEGRRALDFALELTRAPTLATAMRAQPLPPDTLVVIRIAGGCVETAAEAAALTGVAAESLKQAAALYLQKVLFAPDSDCFRLLGVAPGAPRGVMREHMRWLMKWLHPDRNPDEWESIFAERVLAAWREAGSRGAADAGTVAPLHAPPRARRVRQRWVAFPLPPSRKRRSRGLKIAVAILIGAAGLAAASIPAVAPVSKWLAPTAAEAEAEVNGPAD